jgi:ATP-dependent Lon protease
MVLGMLFYVDKLIVQPLKSGVGWGGLSYTEILMGIGIAIFIPLAIKKYGSQVKVAEPVFGEKHDLSATDRLKIGEEIAEMVTSEIQNHSVAHEISKMRELKEQFEADMKIAVEVLHQEKIVEVKTTLDLMLESNITFLKKFVETLSKTLNVKAESLTEVVSQKAIAKSTEQLIDFLEKNTQNLFSEDEITKNIIDKIKMTDTHKEQIDRLKQNIAHIKDKIEKIDSNTVKYGDNEILFDVKKGEESEEKNFKAFIKKK